MKKTWDEWYTIAKKYARTHNGSIASIKKDYVTENGDKLGQWIQVQRNAYKYRDIPNEERKTRLISLTDEQVLKLENLNMIWNYVENATKIRNICKDYFTLEEYRKNKRIIVRIPLRIFEAKLNYCVRNNIPLIVNNRLNHIFYVSNINLEVEYGMTLEELLKEFGPEKEAKNVLSLKY